jgi:NADH-quinone oxidoreductase subunit L
MLYALSSFGYKFVEVLGIDKLVNLTSDGFVLGSKVSSKLQTGNVGTYLLLMVIGVIAILAYNFSNLVQP